MEFIELPDSRSGGQPARPLPVPDFDRQARGPLVAGLPVVAVGKCAGGFMFRDPAGRLRTLTGAQLRRRHELLTLFRGDVGALSRAFPLRFRFVGMGGRAVRLAGIDFDAREAARHLMQLAQARMSAPPPPKENVGSREGR